MAQLVVVDQVLVAECYAKYALPDEGRDGVLEALGIACVLKAGGEPLDESSRPINGAEQQGPGIRRDRTAIEGCDHRAPFNGCR